MPRTVYSKEEIRAHLRQRMGLHNAVQRVPVEPVAEVLGTRAEIEAELKLLKDELQRRFPTAAAASARAAVVPAQAAAAPVAREVHQMGQLQEQKASLEAQIEELSKQQDQVGRVRRPYSLMGPIVRDGVLHPIETLYNQMGELHTKLNAVNAQIQAVSTPVDQAPIAARPTLR